MRKTLAVLAAVGVIAVLAAPSMAAKPPKGGGSAIRSSISLDSNGSLAATGPHLGATVRFATTVGALAGSEYPMVALMCYQDNALVFADLDQPAADFLLGGTSSAWVANGKPASCNAYLQAYGWKHGVESVRTLANTSFDATGA
jgi:hypothetical protein